MFSPRTLLIRRFAAAAAQGSDGKRRVRIAPGRLRWVIVAWGGVSLEKRCVSERVVSIRRIRGWVNAKPIRPRVATRGYPEPLLRSSIRMARRKRFLN